MILADGGFGEQNLEDVVSVLVRLVEAAGAAIIFVGAVIAFARFLLVAFRRPALALALLLDFFTAAALLRLAAPPSWPAIGAAALTIAIRQLASRALTAGRRARHR